MAKAKRGSLAGLSQHVAPKGDAAASAKGRAEAPKRGGGAAKKAPRYLQTRLNDEGWQELKMLSVAERRPVQGLLIEAINDLLRKYRRAPVAEGPAD